MPQRRNVPLIAGHEAARKRAAIQRVKTFLVIALVSMTSLAAAPPPASAAGASLCADYVFVGARGSGEADDYTGLHLGMGENVGLLYKGLRNRAAASGEIIDVEPVRYPAIGVASPDIYAATAFWLKSRYDDSVEEGVRVLLDELDTKTDAAPPGCRTKFILAGYSQGADVVGRAIAAASSDAKDRISAVVLFGDPHFDPADGSAAQSVFNPARGGLLGRWLDPWVTRLASPVYSYCHDGDFVCGINTRTESRDYLHILTVNNLAGEKFDGQHANYIAEGDLGEAVSKVAQKLSFSSPPRATPPSDVVFAIDSTGSMSDTIDAVARNAGDLATTIAGTSSDARFALVDYKDYGDEYQSRVDVSFTKDVDVLKESLDSLQASGGGDYPESMYSGIMSSLSLPWRDGVRKSVVVLADAPGKDPEPGTGYVVQDVVRRAFEVDPAQVYTVAVSGDPEVASFMGAISEATGGTFTDGSDRSTFISSLKDALVQAGTSPTAIVVPGQESTTDRTVELSAKGTRFDLADPVVSYAWNFGDGTPTGSYDETTTSPFTTHEYAEAGDYTVAVSARTQSGLTGLATAPVGIDPVPSEVPAAPTSVTATVDDGIAEIAWRRGAGGGPVERFTIMDAAGTVLGGVIPSVADDQRLAIPVSAVLQVFVVASNAAGDSAATGPVAVGPGGPGTEPPAPPASGVPTLASASSLTLTNQARTTDGGDVVVDGDFGCSSQVSVDGDLIASGNVRLDNTCHVGGDVRAGGSVELVSKPTVGGDVVAAGGVRLQSTARVAGSVTAGGDVVSSDGRTVEQLRSGGTITGEIRVRQTMTAPMLPETAVPTAEAAGTPTVTWKGWLNDIAAAHGAPSWASGRRADPGCTMATKGYDVGEGPVIVSAPTVVDARGAASGCSSVSLQQVRIELGADLTVLADSLRTVNGLDAVSADGQPHRLRVVVPGEGWSCDASRGVELSGGTVVDPLVTTDVLAAGRVGLQGTSSLTGRVAGGCVRSSGAVTLAAPAPVPAP